MSLWPFLAAAFSGRRRFGLGRRRDHSRRFTHENPPPTSEAPLGPPVLRSPDGIPIYRDGKRLVAGASYVERRTAELDLDEEATLRLRLEVCGVDPVDVEDAVADMVERRTRSRAAPALAKDDLLRAPTPDVEAYARTFRKGRE